MSQKVNCLNVLADTRDTVRLGSRCFDRSQIALPGSIWCFSRKTAQQTAPTAGRKLADWTFRGYKTLSLGVDLPASEIGQPGLAKKNYPTYFMAQRKMVLRMQVVPSAGRN